MRCAIIENNFPVCPECSNKDANLLKVIDVDIANISDKTHYEFTAKCRKCDTKFYYFLDIDLFERKAIYRNSDTYSKGTKENMQDIMEEDFDE